MRLLAITLVVAALVLLPTTINAVGRWLAPQEVVIPIKYVRML